jgi:hypothetical protein
VLNFIGLTGQKTCVPDYNVTPDVISAPSFLREKKEKQEGAEERDRESSE